MKEGEGMIADGRTDFIGFSKTVNYKICRKCGITKPETEFYDNDICSECKENELCQV